MLIQCSYCKKILGEKEPLDDKRISHGICKNCSDLMMKELDELMGK